MSKKGDFLSGFSGGATQKPLTEQNTSLVKETDPAEARKETLSKAEIAKNKKLADKIVADEQKKGTTSERVATTNAATRPSQSANAIIKAPAHVVTKDEKFHTRKIIKYAIIGVVSIVVLALIIFLYAMMTRITVPNWVGEDIAQARQWEILDGATLEIERVYDLEAEDTIIAQNREPGTNMSRNAILVLTVSRGPNMNELIELPNFEEMTRAQINTWRTDNQINGVIFREQTSADVDANDVIDVEFPGTVDPENFRRSDSVTIVVSTGPETITISDLRGRDRTAVDEFIESNASIVVEIEYEAHETIPRGTVISQSHAPQTRLAVGDTFTLTLSGGNPFIVPNFANMRRSEAEALMGGGGDLDGDPFNAGGAGGLNVNVLGRWNASIPYGRFVSQSVAAGEELFGDATVTVIYSEGRPWIRSWIGEPAENIESEIVAINDRGSSITVDLVWVDSWQTRGTVISQSHHSQWVALNQRIAIQISRENRQAPPGYVPDLGGGGGNDDGDFEQ